MNGRATSRRRRWIATAAALVTLAGVGGWLAFQPAPKASTAPMISGPTAGGGRYALSSEKGHWVLVNFFASWCTDCHTELAQLAALEHRHPAGLTVVSIDGLDDSLPRAARLIHAGGGYWPLVNDPAALGAYRVTSLPQSFLVSPTGRIAEHVFGGVNAAKLEADLMLRTK